MRLLPFLFVLNCLVSLTTHAQTKGSTSYTFKGSYVDTYIFRGHVYNPETTVLGELGVGIAKWSYNLYHADAVDEDSLGGTLFGREYTHNINYTTISGRKVITYGYQFFDYDGGTVPDTQEIYMRVAHNRSWNPSYGIARDIDAYKGYYLDISLTQFFPITRHGKIVLNIRGGGSFDMEEELDDETQQLLEPAFFKDSGINHGSAHLKYLWQPRNRFKIEVGADYHYAFDDLLYNETTIERDQLLWRAGFTLSLP